MGLQGLASQGVITINWDKFVELFGAVRSPLPQASGILR